jgi:exodeoxyribonuclease V beta subunit
VSVDALGGLRGTAFGSAVHEALEAALSRRSGTFDDTVAAALTSALPRYGIAVDDTALDGLLAAAAAPIGDGPSLRELAPADVLCELRFTMPVADGVDLAAIARAVSIAEPEGDFAAWATAVAASERRRPLAAVLVGSIDLVTSLGTDRLHVVDYKTNVVDASLGYGRGGLVASMRAADYPLQAVLYLVALHRYLRWRRADYDPAAHLGDAYYLYLRGMRPGSSDGVCRWSPGPAAIAAVSDLLAGKR